jgi:hypothetical protein
MEYPCIPSVLGRSWLISSEAFREEAEKAQPLTLPLLSAILELP